MMKFKNLRRSIAFFLVLLVLIIPQVKANPIALPIQFSPFMGIYLIFLFIATISIEVFIILIFLRENRVVRTSRTFYKTVFAINLFSFPMTQLLAYIILDNLMTGNYIFLSILIEIFPITLECVLYLKFFKDSNKILYFDHPVRNKAIIQSTITANLASFAFGLFPFMGFIISYI